MRFPISPNERNERKLKSRYGRLSNAQLSRQKPQEKSGFLPTLGRTLKDNAALLAALIALVGVIYTQYVTSANNQKSLDNQQKLEEQRTLEDEWQTYLNDMGKMVLDERNPLPEAGSNSAVAILARAKTLTMLDTLNTESDQQRKILLLQFLRESNLINVENPVISLDGANLRDVNFHDIHLLGINLSGADLRGADLRGADLSKAALDDADLRGAYLDGADLIGVELRGVDFHNDDLSKANLTKADLSKANLSGADLSDADLRGAYLDGADLVRANLQGAILDGADLNGAILSIADLSGAYLRDAHLSSAHLNDADLSEAELIRADLSGADLQKAENLSKEQIQEANGDENTKLPDHIQRPDHWMKADNE